MKQFLKAVVCVAVINVSISAEADVIYSQLPTGTGSGRISDRTAGGGGANQQADNFSIAADASVGSVEVWGFISGATQPLFSNFTIRFFSDTPGAPTANPFQEYAGLTASSIDTSGFVSGVNSVLHYVINLPTPVSLSAATPYYLSVLNDTVGDPGNWAWYSVQDGTGTRWSRVTEGGAWTGPFTANLSFVLNAEAAPEPTSLLFATLAAGFGVIRARRRKTQG